jgi:hypothetical protein
MLDGNTSRTLTSASPFAFHAALLLELGRFSDALLQVNRGLRQTPGLPALVTLRQEILRRAARTRLDALADDAGLRTGNA